MTIWPFRAIRRLSNIVRFLEMKLWQMLIEHFGNDILLMHLEYGSLNS